MRKVVVTHHNPDSDAICAVWLVLRFLENWQKAEVEFVPAGEKIADESAYEKVIHVDTGLGEFDHHQSNSDTCAAKLVFEHLASHKELISDLKNFNPEVLERLVNVVNEIDHFRQVYYPDPNADYFDFSLAAILDGLNLVYNGKGSGDILTLESGLAIFDAIYQVFKNKIRAEKEIAEGRVNEVETKWGRAIGFETGNDQVLGIAQKMGYRVVVRKDRKKDYVRIKALPEKGIDLTRLYERLKEMDKQATWYLHPSKTILLNGSTSNPKMRATKLTLPEIMEEIGKINN